MTKIILHGCNGMMGQTISRLAKEDAAVEIAAGIDVNTEQKFDYPVYASLAECKEQADVVIDFASMKAVDGLLDYCGENKLPVVLCTTGLTKEQIEKVEETAKKTAVLRSANMSLGINLLLKLVREAAEVLANAGFDMEIVEKHHNQKKDAPSGTALALAEVLNEAVDHRCEYTYDRSTKHEKRDKNEIGISAVRGGTIVGEHDVIFAGTDEVVTFSHTAYSKSIFAKGAISAAKFLAGKEAGLYTMKEVIS
ncbi:MAG: 4-hydroxy-tetrahydrodipicolinate reductase [bacterium]|nr:4-hydroxy-tetrahydrodipicolinate reductase [bacterium]